MYSFQCYHFLLFLCKQDKGLSHLEEITASLDECSQLLYLCVVQYEVQAEAIQDGRQKKLDYAGNLLPDYLQQVPQSKIFSNCFSTRLLESLRLMQ